MIPDVLLALGLVFVIEGLLYALVPGKLKAMMLGMQKLSDDQLRIGGLVVMGVGVAIAWFARGMLN